MTRMSPSSNRSSISGHDVSRAIEYARRNGERFLSELNQFVRFPSVSIQPGHDRDTQRCAAWLSRHLRSIGMQHVQVVSTRRHPIVYGKWIQRRKLPTILIYGHYDVQPAEPVEEWASPPFEPSIRNSRMYGRGASDDKGQLFAHVKALESFLKTRNALPVNVKCVFEGDEETGDSRGLDEFVDRNRSELRADAVVISDTRMLGPRSPAIGYSQRGNLRLELEVTGPTRDLHSGNFGGVVHNPLQALSEMLAGLHDHNHRITIAGFYDNVRKWSDEERTYMHRTGPKSEAILSDANVPQSWGESGFSAYERVTLRPALTLNGIHGGYGGSGIKTIIPSRALAKLSIRLVPDQRPEEIEKLFRSHIARVTPPTVKAEVRTIGSSSPTLVKRNHPALSAAALAYRKAFANWPVFLRSGGSIPAASIFQTRLGVPILLMGFALSEDRAHAANESFYLPNFFRGIEASIWYLTAMRTHRQRFIHPDSIAVRAT
jgi:acetylornithine deacetylase/succinyl-diaminopimelate desuccinylase-like protein